MSGSTAFKVPRALVAPIAPPGTLQPGVGAVLIPRRE